MADAAGGELVRLRLEEAARVLSETAEADAAEAGARAAALIVEAYVDGGKVLVFGNGGSAADAQHLAGELVGRYLLDRPPLAAIALVDNAASMTSIGNDFGFEEVFSRQVEGVGRPGDVAIGLSTSGRSPNVVAGLATARRMGLGTVALTGCDPGPVGDHADVTIAVPSVSTPRIQEGHAVLGHAVCEIVEAALANRSTVGVGVGVRA